MFFIFPFFFFRRDSSNLRDSRFFPGLKSHEAIRTAHWRTMALFTTPFFSSRITYQQNIIVTQDRQSRNTVGVRECLKPVIIQPMFLCFLLSCNIFRLFYYWCHFFLAADACLSWSLPSITEQQVSRHRLHWLKNHRLSSNTTCTPTVFLIQQSYVIITFHC